VTETATLLVENIGELVTLDPRRDDAPGVVRDAALVAVGERIVYAGPMAGLDVTTDEATVAIDARGAAVVPGFVDCHTHICWLGDRAEEYALRASGVSYEEIARRGGGIRSTVRATTAGSLDDLREATRRHAERMLRLGTTTVEVKTGYGMTVAAEQKQLAAISALVGDETLPDIVPTWLPLHGIPEGDRDAYLEEILRNGVHAAARLAERVDCFCDDGAWSVDECRRMFEGAAAEGMTPVVHAEQRAHNGAAQLAASVHAASADHLDHATDEDFAALAAGRVCGVILPGASLVLGTVPPPGRQMLDAGMHVAIATDCNPGTCYSESMPLMMSLAVANAGLTPAEALLAATAGGAAALRLTDRGRLVAGQRCDAVIVDSPHWLDVAYHLGANPVDRVIRRGVVAD
jgi:imidazolonepropionase